MISRADPPMILRSLDPKGVFRVNATFVDHVGFTPRSLALRPFSEWIHPDDWPQVDEVLRAGVGRASGRHWTNEGTWLRFEWQVRSDDDGPVALGLPPGGSGAAARPTPSIVLETASSTSGALEATARVVEAKNPGMRCSILLVDPSDGRVTVGAGPSFPKAYNDAVGSLTIGPAVGSCGTAAFWNVPVIVRNIAEDPLWADLRGAAALAGVQACWSCPITTRNGGVLGAIALYDDEPRTPTEREMEGLEVAARMVGLAMERERLEERLREAAKMEAIGRVASGVAHDFNNLLHVILGHVELIREAGDTAPPPGTVDAIIRAVNHGSDITEQLLAFGRKQVNSPERVVVGEFLLDVMRVFAPLIGHDITVSVRSDPTLGSIWIDRTQLERIILNLVLNAREAMPDGGSLDIEARHATRHEVKGMDSASVRASLVAITVTDTGRGMDPATKDHMFEPFFTTKANGHATGLGLATVYGLMKQNRGYVSAESEVGEGTRFLLLFSRDESSIPAPSGPPVGNGSRGASVLVAEDNDEIRNLLASILVTGGFDVNLARNGAEALSLCEDGLVVDLLITDLMMPQMGGVELARRLRRIQPEVGTVFVSGHPLEKANLPELDAKREAYLAKPFTPAQLRQEVHRALANSRPTPAE